MKITVIIGTNRKDSRTAIVAKKYFETLASKGLEPKLLSLRDLFEGYKVNHAFGVHENSFEQILKSHLEESEKFLFVIPEYNGGFPGVLKFFIDMIPPKVLHYKKAALVGLSSGRAGNLRGMEHFTGVLNYLKVHVLANKPKLSGIDALLENDELTDNHVLKELDNHANELIAF